MRGLNISSIQQSTYVKCFISRGRIYESIFFFGSVASSSQEMKAFVFLSSWLKWSFILPLSFAGLRLDLVHVVFSAHPSPASRHTQQVTMLFRELSFLLNQVIGGAHTLLPAVTPGPQRGPEWNLTAGGNFFIYKALGRKEGSERQRGTER